MDNELLDDLLSEWARWHRLSATERMALAFPPRVSWAGPSNWMAGENDANDLWDARHSSTMRAVEASISDLPRRLQSAMFQTHRLGSLGQPVLRDLALQIVYDMAILELVPHLEKRGILI